MAAGTQERETTGWIDLTPGWLYVLAGLALLAVAAIVPSWRACEQLEWQRRVMAYQLERLEIQQQRYAGFHSALASDDPVVLERVAFTLMRQKPVGKDVLIQAASYGSPPGAGAALSPVDSGWIDQWLSEPMPVVGAGLPAFQPANTRLVRLGTGRNRLLLLLAGVACLAGGIWACRHDDDTEQRFGHVRPELLARLIRARGR